MHISKFSAALVASTFLTFSAAHAAVIFDTSVTPATADNAEVSDADLPFFRAQQVTFATDVTIRGLDWSGVYVSADTPTGQDDFTFELYSDVSGLPALTATSSLSVSLTERVDSGVDLGGVFDIFEYSGNVSALSVVAGTYWVSLFNDTSDDTDDDWFWSRVVGGDSAGRSSAGLNWFAVDFTKDLTLFDEAFDDGMAAIPLPASSLLLLGALGGLVGVRRYKAPRV